LPSLAIAVAAADDACARVRAGTPTEREAALRGTKGPFHGDQHCAQGPIGIAAAVAMAEFLGSMKTPGTVTVYGTPAEKLLDPSAKTVMHKANVSAGADIIVRSHSSMQTSRRRPALAPAA
jgi:metal-dependent amidase/aminoacylase/carboxypeptidase family protein